MTVPACTAGSSARRASGGGTVIHYHGNGRNLTAHVGHVDWLPAAGYDVFLFDYRGYGRSHGAPGRDGVHADAQAALRYVRSRDDVDPDRILALGQSLGGAVCLAALGEGDRTGVRGIAVDSTFLEYRSVANSRLGGTFLTYPLVWLLVSGDHDPADSIGELAGTPLLVMHGDADRTVPMSEGEAVFAAASEPKEIVRHADGYHTRFLQTTAGRQRLLRFFSECLSGQD